MSRMEITFQNNRSVLYVEPGSLALTGTRLAELCKPGKILIVTDSNVGPLYAEQAIASVREAGFEPDIIQFQAGEATKSIESLQAIWNKASEMGITRDCVMLGLGGGVISDLTGFAAATWMRGTRFAICPTTVEADIDASIGGKTAVNHPAGKNLVGAFHQPILVNIDPVCLKTLEPRDLVAGLGESIKHAAIADPEFLTWHEKNRQQILAGDPDTLAELIERNSRIKADIVERDEREQSAIRAALNFGHTIGHAIEADRQFELRHGECVALGMVSACFICMKLGLLTHEESFRLQDCLEAYGLPTKLDRLMKDKALMEYLVRDKKASAGKVRFTLLEGFGNPILRDDVSEELMIEAYKTLAKP